MESYSKILVSMQFHDFEKYSELIDETNDSGWVEVKRKAYGYNKDRCYNEGCLTWIDDIDQINQISEDENSHCVFYVYDENMEHNKKYVAIESKEQFEQMIKSTYIQAEVDNKLIINNIYVVSGSNGPIQAFVDRDDAVEFAQDDWDICCC